MKKSDFMYYVMQWPCHMTLFWDRFTSDQHTSLQLNQYTLVYMGLIDAFS